MVPSRSIRFRRAAPAVALATRTRRGRRVGLPTSRYTRSFRYGGVSPASRQLFGRGVAGSSRHAFARVGREVPLYINPRSRAELTEAHVYTGTTSSLTFADVANQLVLLNPVTQGTSLENRLASRITMLQLQVRGEVRASYTNVALPIGFWAIVYDRQPQGVLPAVTDIYETVSVDAFQVLGTRDRFQILYRQDFQLETNNSGPTSDGLRRYDRVVHFRLPTTFTTPGITGTIADIRTGALYLVYAGWDQVTGTNLATGRFSFRLMFAP